MTRYTKKWENAIQNWKKNPLVEMEWKGTEVVELAEKKSETITILWSI